MNLGDSLIKIRRMVRDKNSKVFSDEQITRIYEEVSREFASDTLILEKEIDLPMPGFLEMSLTQEWEKEYSIEIWQEIYSVNVSIINYDTYSRGTSLRGGMVFSFSDNYTYTQPWEPSILRGVSPSVSGGITSSQPWESFYATIQNRLVHYFPHDYISYTYVAYDEKPIGVDNKHKMQKHNSSFFTKFGDYPTMYLDDYGSGAFYLYPKVNKRYAGNDLTSDHGEVMYDSDTNLEFDSDYGVATFSDAETFDSDYGVIIDYQVPSNNITLVYSRYAISLSGDSTESELPSWTHKYIECGVINKLFRMDTDLQNLLLSKHFKDRYKAGLKLTHLYLSDCKTMRAYKLRQDGVRSNNKKRLADLPSHYPSYWR